MREYCNINGPITSIDMRSIKICIVKLSTACISAGLIPTHTGRKRTILSAIKARFQ